MAMNISRRRLCVALSPDGRYQCHERVSGSPHVPAFPSSLRDLARFQRVLPFSLCRAAYPESVEAFCAWYD